MNILHTSTECSWSPHTFALLIGFDDNVSDTDEEDSAMAVDPDGSWAPHGTKTVKRSHVSERASWLSALTHIVSTLFVVSN